MGTPRKSIAKRLTFTLAHKAQVIDQLEAAYRAHPRWQVRCAIECIARDITRVKSQKIREQRWRAAQGRTPGG